MVRSIDRDELVMLVGQGAQLVEVLPAEEYDADHLPNAINIPLRDLEQQAGTTLDTACPVIVYCWDIACDLSPRAARRLETLGFSPVYDYAVGKLDWMAAGLPTEGTKADHPRGGTIARRDVLTCTEDETLGTVRVRADAAGQDTCVVVDTQHVVVGLLRKSELDGPEQRLATAAMRHGPSTFRPHVDIEELAEYFADRDLESAPITTSTGELVGLLERTQAEAAAARNSDSVPRRQSA